MDQKALVKEQFDRQAKQFSSWLWTKSAAALGRLFDFIGFSDHDCLLDVACGSGNFAVFCAQRIASVQGVDISPRMIELARQLAAEAGLDNLTFGCHDVTDLPFEAGRFSVVTSKSAFHHMLDYERVLREMARCCADDGLLCLNDITTYGHPQVNTFFDEFDRIIDPSHCARISPASLRGLFASNGVRVLKAEAEEFEIGVSLYASHVHQTPAAAKQLEQLIEEGLSDPLVSQFLYRKEDQIVFKNKALRILGRKQSAP